MCRLPSSSSSLLYHRRYPTPLNCTSKFEVSVGRIRESIAFPQGKSIELFVCGDQLLRGAALNAVSWLELYIQKSSWVGPHREGIGPTERLVLTST